MNINEAKILICDDSTLARRQVKDVVRMIGTPTFFEAEKIKMLEGYLPDILVKNATIYGILSKGIHELSEEECREYFPVVKGCIYQILGMWESERRKKADEDALSKALSSISSSIK